MLNFLKKKKDELLDKEEQLKAKGYQERHVVYFANGHILRMYTKMLEDGALTNYVDMNGNPVSIPGYANLVCYHIVEQLQGNSLEVLRSKENTGNSGHMAADLESRKESAPETHKNPMDKLKDLQAKLKGKR